MSQGMGIRHKWFVAHGYKMVSFRVCDPKGREWRGVFGDASRGRKWAEARLRGDYSAILKDY